MSTKRASRVKIMDNAYVKHQEEQAEYLRKKRRGLFRRLCALAIIACSLGGLSFVTIYAQTSTLEQKEQEKLVLIEQLKQLEVEEERLHQDIKNYNDLDYIADIARRDYYLTKPGETLFKLPEPSSN